MDPSPRSSSAVDAIWSEAAAALLILRDAPAVAARSWRLFLPAVLLVLLPSCLFSVSHHFLFDASTYPARSQPLLATVPRPAATALLDGNLLVVADFGFLLAYWLLDLFELAVAVFGAAAACREERPRLRETLRRIRREWRGPVATQICVSVLRRGYWALCDVFADALLPLAAGPSAYGLMSLGSLLFVAVNLLYYYFDAAWESSLGATAVDSCGGFRALGLAGELTEGRGRLRGAIVGLLYAGIFEGASLLFDFVLRLDMAEAARMGLTAGFRGLLEVMYMYKMVAFTLFYYRCRGSRWEDGRHYSRLPAAPPTG